ncbi:hypothetical protein HKD37_16G045736 [Glycine soja]
MNMDRARLVYDLVMKMDMDVGSIISTQISQMAQSNSSKLGFPALITALCIARGVVSDSLTFESLSPAISLAYIRKNCWNPNDPTITFPGSRKARARAPSNASASVPAPTPAPFPLTPASTPSLVGAEDTLADAIANDATKDNLEAGEAEKTPADTPMLKKRRCKKLLMNSLSEADWLSEPHSLSKAASSLSGCKTLEEDKSEISMLSA